MACMISGSETNWRFSWR